MIARVAPLLLLATCLAAATPHPPEIAAWTAADKAAQRTAGQELLALIAAAAERGDDELLIPTAHYRFDQDMLDGRRDTHLLLRELHDLTIDFQGSTLWFEQTFGGVLLAKCADLTIRNLQVDWDPLPFNQGEVIAVDPSTKRITVRIDPAWLAAGADVTTDRDYRATTFDPATRRMRAGQAGYVLRKPVDRGDGTVAFTVGVFYDRPLAVTAIAVGDPIAIFARMGRAWRIENCDRVTLEDVTLYASPFVAFAQQGGAGRTTYRRVAIVRRPGTDRLMAGNADGINVANAERGPLLEDCRMDPMGDDFVNLHASYVRVLARDGERAIITSPPSNPIATRVRAGEPSSVAIYARADMALIGRRQVVATETIEGYVPEEDACLADLSRPFRAGAAAGLRYGTPTRVVRLQLDRPLDPGHDPILVCEDFSGAGAEIRGGEFQGSLARGFRLQAPDVTVSGCTLIDTMGPAITCSGQPGYWGEGPYVHRATISDCTFIDTAIGGHPDLADAAIVIHSPAGADSAFRQTDFTITGNRFERSAGPAIHAELVDGIAISGNTIIGHGARPNLVAGSDRTSRIGPEEHGHAIVLAGCSSVDVGDNMITDPGRFAVSSVLELAAPTPKR